MALALVGRPKQAIARWPSSSPTAATTLSYLDEADVTSAATRAQCALFFVAVTDGTRQRPMPSPHEKFFSALAETTGGLVEILQDDEDLGPSFLRALEDFRTSYVLRYVKAGGVEPGWHELAVRVTKPGPYDVRARKGYFGTR